MILLAIILLVAFPGLFLTLVLIGLLAKLITSPLGCLLLIVLLIWLACGIGFLPQYV